MISNELSVLCECACTCLYVPGKCGVSVADCGIGWRRVVGGLCLPSQMGWVYCVIGQSGQLSFAKLTEETKPVVPALNSSQGMMRFMSQPRL